MSVSVRSRPTPGKWMVDVYFKWPDGSVFRDRKVIGAPSKASARRWGELREAELRGGAKPSPAANVLTVAEVARLFVANHLRANLKKASAIDAAASILDIHVLPFIGAKRCDEVTDDVIAELRAKWLAGGYPIPKGAKAGRLVKPTKSRKTLNNRLLVVSSMLRRAVEWKARTGLASMPCAIKLLAVDDQKTPEFYDHETYERVVQAAAELGPRYLAVVLLGGDAGLRLGEILGLNLEDVDFKLKQVTPRRSIYRSKTVEYADTPKGRKAVPVESTDRLLAALKAVRHLRGPRVFNANDGGSLTQKGLKVWIKRVERKAGLPVLGKLHIFRHTFCSHLAMAGVPAMTIKELARHDDLKTTQRYMHLSPSAKREGIAMLARSREAGGTAVGHGNRLATGAAK
jgi:integrase